MGRAFEVKIVKQGEDGIEIEVVKPKGRLHSGQRFWVSEKELRRLELERALEIVASSDCGVSHSSSLR